MLDASPTTELCDVHSVCNFPCHTARSRIKSCRITPPRQNIGCSPRGTQYKLLPASRLETREESAEINTLFIFISVYRIPRKRLLKIFISVLGRHPWQFRQPSVWAGFSVPKSTPILARVTELLLNEQFKQWEIPTALCTFSNVLPSARISYASQSL